MPSKQRTCTRPVATGSEVASGRKLAVYEFLYIIDTHFYNSVNRVKYVQICPVFSANCELMSLAHELPPKDFEALLVELNFPRN